MRGSLSVCCGFKCHSVKPTAKRENVKTESHGAIQHDTLSVGQGFPMTSIFCSSLSPDKDARHEVR